MCMYMKIFRVIIVIQKGCQAHVALLIYGRLWRHWQGKDYSHTSFWHNNYCFLLIFTKWVLILFTIFLSGIFGFLLEFFGFFWIFWILSFYFWIFWFFGIFLGFFCFFLGFLSKLLMLLLKVTKVTTGHQKLPKTGQNSIITSFIARRVKKPRPKAEALRRC